MALLNVAAELRSRGRRVLIVDFDLEAPGLDTFPMKLDRPVTRGLVEMISEYLGSSCDSTPPIKDFLYEAKLDGLDDSPVWLLPAGRQDDSYDSRFRDIDWQDFYENQGGFLFFEDLKLQWKEAVSPDYVLVDSRTGHTDIGGICTRQLPDCVAVVFYPNEQNLRGLVPVVEDIRSEEAGPLKKKIDIQFVMANVPDLDDEESILARACANFSATLKYQDLAATIHHINSFSMLTQRLLILDRPNSKIAGEYKQLASAIARRNLEDRDGAISVLDQGLVDLRTDSDSGAIGQLEKKLELIAGFHSHDVEVMRRMARIRRMQRRNDEALELFEHVLELNDNDGDSLVGKAELLLVSGDRAGATQDLEAFFSLGNVSSFSFALATRLLMLDDRQRVPRLLTSPAISSLPLSTVSDVLQELQRSHETCNVAASFIQIWAGSNPDALTKDQISAEVSMCLIGAGNFEEAKKQISGMQDSTDLRSRFNYAMAEWGASGQLPRKLFEQTVFPKIAEALGDTEINHLQCFSLAYWVIQDRNRALQILDEAGTRFASAPRSVFSCWSYLYRSPRDFRHDLDRMRAVFTEGKGEPEYIAHIRN